LPITSQLVRIKNTKPQVKLTAAERKTNVKDCFEWLGGNLNNKNIILIDDVTTTGSTLNECAKALKNAGAGEVWGLAVANG
jgi:predicted amidophosphoribosyltransferase